MASNRCLRALRALGITLALGASLLAGAVHAQGSTTIRPTRSGEVSNR